MHEFPTPEPVRLRVELGAGDVRVEAVDTDTTTVDLRARDDHGRELLERAVVEQRGDEVVVEVPRRGGLLRGSPGLSLEVRVPTGSRADVRTDSADVVATGRLGDCRVKTGSGDVRLDAVAEVRVDAGSGDVALARAEGAASISSGSGDLSARELRAGGKLDSGSGDISVEASGGPLQVNAASGDVQVAAADDEVRANTASGDISVRRVQRGRVQLQSAAGDLHVGVAGGVPVWLDANTLSGTVSSDLDGGDPPTEGEDSVELRAHTASGDIVLTRA